VDGLITLAGFGVGFIVGLTGVGGGAIMTPLLIFGFGIPPVIAVGTDLFYAALTKAGGIWTHARQGTVDWVIVRRLASGSLPAVLVTLWVLERLAIGHEQLGGLITTTLGVALIITALAIFLRGRIRAMRVEIDPRWQTPATIATGAVVGVLVTLTSVGAGALTAAALLWLYPRQSTVRVVGTDLAHAVPLAALAGIGHWQLGSVDFNLLGMLLLGSLPGIFLGSRYSSRLPEQWLRPLLATLLFFIGFRLVA
jgi:uncharacterized membrane protein YfcA